MDYILEETIHDAVRSGNVQRVYRVLQRNPLCVNDSDTNFNSPLHLIYDHVELHDLNNQADDRLPIMNLLIEYGANVNNRNERNDTPLLAAVEKNQINGVKILLENKADPNIRQCFDQTVLLRAVYARYTCIFDKDDEMIKLLLDNRADPNLSDCCGETALDYAIEFRKLNYVQLLLASGARVKNIYQAFFKPFNWIGDVFELPNEEYSTRYSIWIEFLLRHVDQISKQVPFSLAHFGYYKEESLRSNIEKKRINSLLVLLQKRGIDVNRSGSIGDSDLHKAVHKENVTLVKALLQREDTNVNVTNFYLDTPLHLIMRKGKIFSTAEIGRFLLEAGANWRAPNLMDETPFYLAVKNQQCTLIELILSKIARARVLKCNFSNLPNLKICYTENDIALHELLVAISFDWERVIDHLLDEAYNIDEKSKSCRRDITIALVKAVELNKCKIVKKLLEAGFRSDGCCVENLSDLIRMKGNKIKLFCLLWEFDERSILVKLFHHAVHNYSSNSDSNILIYVLFFYYAIDEYVNGSVPDLKCLQVYFARENTLIAKFTECKNDLLQMKNVKISDLSVFNIMTMELDSFIKLLNNQEIRDSCINKVKELQNLGELKYYHFVLQYRLKLALEKNLIMNAALKYFNNISMNCLSRTNLTNLPYNLGWDTLSHLNMRDLKKFVK